MKKYSKVIIMLITTLLLGALCSALHGRASTSWFNRYTISAVLFTVAYFFGADLSENNTQTLVTSVLAVGVPAAMMRLIIDSEYFFGYTKMRFTGGAFVFGGIICAACFLTKNNGPLRAALGRCFVPAFLAAEAVNRLIYFRNSYGSWFDLGEYSCKLAVFLLVLALAVFILANREKLFKGDAYVALVIWGVVFAVLIFAGRKIEPLHIPILF